MKNYSKFVKYSHHGDATKFHKDVDALYDSLIATRGKMPFSINMMDQFLVENGIDGDNYISNDKAYEDAVTRCNLGIKTRW